MTLSTSTLRPGFLVSLKTSCRGNVRYDKVDLDEQHDAEIEVTKWETTRTIADRDEYERAKKAQSKASSIIRSVCTVSAFGYLCPEGQATQLEAAIKAAHAVVEAFNVTAQLTRVSIYVIAGRIAQDDVEAVRAINSEVRQLMDDMEAGLQKLDVEVIRTAANKARQLGNMLSPDAQVRVQLAIDAARGAAKKIVAAGEAAEIEVDKYAIMQLKTMRTAFLDMSDQAEISRPQTTARAIEFGPTQEAEAWAAWRKGGDDAL